MMIEAPALVFLDIDKNDGIKNPFNLVKDLYPYVDEIPAFVALSNSKRKAYDVIKNDFKDYLLKPVSHFEFRKFLVKYSKEWAKKNHGKICLKSYSDYQIIDLNDVLYLQADNNTTDFYLIQNRKVTAFKTLKLFEFALPSNFLRIHNSYIINVRHISRINFARSLIFLDDNSLSIPFSRSYRTRVDQIKNNYSSPLAIVS
nr:LytTR family transcriptional regulator DNA-binding domain-containing protein [Salinimicrobium profundisediminis]